MGENQLVVYENGELWKILGSTLENGEWRLRHNQEINTMTMPSQEGWDGQHMGGAEIKGCN